MAQCFTFESAALPRGVHSLASAQSDVVLSSVAGINQGLQQTKLDAGMKVE